MRYVSALPNGYSVMVDMSPRRSREGTTMHVAPRRKRSPLESSLRPRRAQQELSQYTRRQTEDQQVTLPRKSLQNKHLTAHHLDSLRWSVNTALCRPPPQPPEGEEG